MFTIRIIAIIFTFISRCRFPRNQSIVSTIRTRYDNETVKLLRKFEKQDFKFRKSLLDIAFLLDCVKYHLSPRFVEFKTSNKLLKDSDAYKACQLKLLLQEIENKKKHSQRLKSLLEKTQTNLKNVLSLWDYTHVVSMSLSSNDQNLQKKQFSLDKKLSKIAERQNPNKLVPDKIIKNYSTHVLSEHECSLLTKGLNFAVLPSRLNYADHCLNFELFFRDLNKIDHIETRNKDFLKSKLKDIALSSFRDYHKNPRTPDNLTTEEFNALQNLSNHNDIIIQKADKGNCVVVIDKLSYLQSVEDILNDRTKFAPTIVKNETLHMIEIEDRIKVILQKLEKANKITKAEYNRMYPMGTRPGILYGLAKVHKALVNNLPVPRPILSAIGTPTYKLSKFLLPLMTPISTNDHTVSDSFEFARQVLDYDSSLFMASLDVKSLFTNIPLDETINIACDELFKARDIVQKLTKQDFKDLLSTAVKESLFLFNKRYYQQIDGVAMGNPLGPTMANIFMCNFEQKWLANCPTEFKPLVYKRYVDDIFVLFREKHHLQQFKDYFNNCHENIEFTDDTEKDNHLAFLDIKIYRENNKFLTSIYRKPTFTGLYSNFTSLIPMEYKKGLVSTLLFRLYSVCANWSIFSLELSKLKNILIANGYPLTFIEERLRIFLDKIHQPKNTKEAQDSNLLQITLPFLGKMSLKIKREITKAIRTNIPSCRLRVVFTSKRRIANFFSFKDPIPVSIQSHLVYKVTCDDCNAIYYGLTDRHYKVRSYDHMGKSIRTEKPIVGIKTAMKDHCTECQHHITNDSFSIIARSSDAFHLKIKESLLIKRDRPFLNNNVYSTPLYLF